MNLRQNYFFKYCYVVPPIPSALTMKYADLKVYKLDNINDMYIHTRRTKHLVKLVIDIDLSYLMVYDNPEMLLLLIFALINIHYKDEIRFFGASNLRLDELDAIPKQIFKDIDLKYLNVWKTANLIYFSKDLISNPHLNLFKHMAK